MSASQRSSSTTIGSVMPSRLAVATSPHVIWKQPSPNRQTTGASGRASLAAIALGRPKPMDDQPLVMWKVLGACARDHNDLALRFGVGVQDGVQDQTLPGASATCQP